MIEATAQNALSSWGLDGAHLSLVAQRENIVFRVKHAAAQYALRLHRPGYQSVQMMKSELAWMQHLGAEGLNVPAPLPSDDGALLRAVGGYQADLLTWLSGTPMGETGKPLDLPDRIGTFRRVGRLMARVHQVSDDWDLPEGFERKSWDIGGLLGDAPLWDRFWDNPGLSDTERARVMAARDGLRAELSDDGLDLGLIHADMLRENIMIDGDNLGLIDFDDSGFGFRLFDVATALFKNRAEPDFDGLQTAFLNGYREVRPLDTTLLPQFMLVRALSYLGWIITRMDEPGAKTRQKRFLSSSLPMVDAYLEGIGPVARVKTDHRNDGSSSIPPLDH
ncbi:MAG: phosphotransferase enzyme family protein [Ruegeria sp.]|uniref:phosphotransferase enzyme family protein n=1 Tax=Ruegeria sp. TaxID=1879320 RepID=UPI00349E5B72